MNQFLRFYASSLSENTRWQIQFSSMEWGYVDNKMVSFHVLNRTEPKKFLLIIFLHSFYLGPESTINTNGNGIFIILAIPRKKQTGHLTGKELPQNTSVGQF